MKLSCSSMFTRRAVGRAALGALAAAVLVTGGLGMRSAQAESPPQVVRACLKEEPYMGSVAVWTSDARTRATWRTISGGW